MNDIFMGRWRMAAFAVVILIWLIWATCTFVFFPGAPSYCIHPDLIMIGPCRNLRFAQANLGFLPLLGFMLIVRITALLKSKDALSEARKEFYKKHSKTEDRDGNS